MSEQTCATHGHLYGMSGRCLFCPAVREAVQPPATPQDPDVRGDIERQNAEIQRLGNAVRDGSATPEMAYAWLTHPYVCTSDMVKAAARIMASTPSPEGQTWQPIETAPKNGTRIDLWAKSWLPAFDRFEFRRFADCYWSKGDTMCNVKAAWAGLDREWHPTHWMPLPSPPTPEGTQP